MGADVSGANNHVLTPRRDPVQDQEEHGWTGWEERSIGRHVANVKGRGVAVGIDGVRSGKFQESLTHRHGVGGETGSDNVDLGGLDGGFIGGVELDVPVVAAVVQSRRHTSGTRSLLVEPRRVPTLDRVLSGPLSSGIILVGLW